MYACMYACMHVCMYICMYVCMYVCMYMYVYIYIYIYTCTCTCIYVYIYIYIYVYIYIYNINIRIQRTLSIVYFGTARHSEQHRSAQQHAQDGTSRTTAANLQQRLISLAINMIMIIAIAVVVVVLLLIIMMNPSAQTCGGHASGTQTYVEDMQQQLKPNAALNYHVGVS